MRVNVVIHIIKGEIMSYKNWKPATQEGVSMTRGRGGFSTSFHRLETDIGLLMSTTGFNRIVLAMMC